MMPPAKKAAPTTAAEVPPGDEAVARYQAALIEGKTEDEARLIAWPDALPGIEDAGHDQPNAMLSPTGGWFYPDGPEDAAVFAGEHDAAPVWPDRWPWGWPLPAAERETHCPMPAACFPYGIGEGWHGCIHGETA